MEYLKKSRMEKGLTREYVCNQTGISMSKLAKLERSEIDSYQCSFISMVRLFSCVASASIDLMGFVIFLHDDFAQIQAWKSISADQMALIASYMDDEARDQVHCELAPCDPLTFINRYLEINPDQDFVYILKNEFGLELD